MSTGTVFSIEEFALNDGPGIRTTVFLKGCPLRCTWCHNPEGQKPEPEPMQRYEGVQTCGEIYTSEALAARLLRDKDFFRMNDGGVTFTGGEPAMQAGFMVDVLKRLDGVHRAVETSGFCSTKVFADILENIDHVLFDLKIIDAEEHRRWTGVDNTPIIANFRSLKASGKPFVVRIPLIPGVNDSERNLRATRDLITEGSPAGLQRVEILRYHKTAGAKYAAVGMVYSPGFDTDAIPEPHTEIFEGLNVLVL